jgi:hypothetical protein
MFIFQIFEVNLILFYKVCSFNSRKKYSVDCNESSGGKKQTVSVTIFGRDGLKIYQFRVISIKLFKNYREIIVCIPKNKLPKFVRSDIFPQKESLQSTDYCESWSSGHTKLPILCYRFWLSNRPHKKNAVNEKTQAVSL